MDQKVNSVETLYSDACNLYTDIVEGGGEYSAKTVIDHLVGAIDNLKQNWKGKDAGVQINNIINVHNAMIEVRNALALLSYESSGVASTYREIQNANGAGLETLTPLSTENRTVMGAHEDNGDTIDITVDVVTGRDKVNSALTSIEAFIPKVQTKYNDIIENWSKGDEKRQKCIEAFENFIANVGTYKESLSSVATSIDTAIRNYNIG